MAATIEQWMRDAAKDFSKRVLLDAWVTEETLAEIIASHAPSDLWIECLGCQRTGHFKDVVKVLDAPSEAAKCKVCGEPILNYSGRCCEVAAHPDGYCSIAPTAPHPHNKDCVSWTPEIEHNDH